MFCDYCPDGAGNKAPGGGCGHIGATVACFQPDLKRNVLAGGLCNLGPVAVRAEERASLSRIGRICTELGGEASFTILKTSCTSQSRKEVMSNGFVFSQTDGQVPRVL